MFGTALLLTILEKSFEKWAENEGTAAITKTANGIGAWSWEARGFRRGRASMPSVTPTTR